jgi:hypothetical protein
VTLKAVNDELARLGHKASLTKADGYFYFQGNEPDTWLDRTGRVATLGSLSLEDWVAEYNRLKKLNKSLLTRGNAGS